MAVRAVHAAHGLRGSASTAEAAHVRALARRLEIPHSVLRAPVAAGPGLEQRAREARFEAFRRSCKRHGVATLLLAHHQDDQVETIVMRVLRDAGPRGLRGIPADRPLSPDTRVIRPLLRLSGEVIDSAARALGLTWCDDQSNRDLQWTRNRIRHQVLPRIREHRPGVLRVGEQAERTWRALGDAVDILRPTAVRLAADAVVGFDLGTLQALPHAVAFAVVDDALQAPLAADGWRLLTGLMAAGSGRRTLPHGLDAQIHDGVLWVADPRGDRCCERRLGKGRTIEWNATAVMVTRGGVPSATGAIEAARHDPNLACVGASAVRGPLTVRVPRPGDRMLPLGGHGSRRVADMLSTARVPRPLRPWWPIVYDDEGPVWFPQGPIAQRVAWVSGRAEVLRCDKRKGPPEGAGL